MLISGRSSQFNYWQVRAGEKSVSMPSSGGWCKLKLTNSADWVTDHPLNKRPGRLGEK